MTDDMARLGRMVDEAVGETGAPTNLAGRSRVAPAQRSAAMVAGDGVSTSYQAIEDVCWIYRSRNLAESCRGWREARRRVTCQGPLGKEWISHREKPPVRLTRGGVEMKLADGIRTLSWEQMQSQVRAWRS